MAQWKHHRGSGQHPGRGGSVDRQHRRETLPIQFLGKKFTVEDGGQLLVGVPTKTLQGLNVPLANQAPFFLGENATLTNSGLLTMTVGADIKATNLLAAKPNIVNTPTGVFWKTSDSNPNDNIQTLVEGPFLNEGELDGTPGNPSVHGGFAAGRS